MGPWETMIRRRIAEAMMDAAACGPGLRHVRERDAEALRRILRTWEATTTAKGREAAELGLPTGPFDGGVA